jgi:hypothetical protein
VLELVDQPADESAPRRHPLQRAGRAGRRPARGADEGARSATEADLVATDGRHGPRRLTPPRRPRCTSSPRSMERLPGAVAPAVVPFAGDPSPSGRLHRRPGGGPPASGAACRRGRSAPQRTWHADQATVPDAGPPAATGRASSWRCSTAGSTAPTRTSRAACSPAPTASAAPARRAPPRRPVRPRDARRRHRRRVVVRCRAEATILPVRVLSYDTSSGECVGRPDDVTAGIRWAVRNGAQVLNLSLGPDVPGLSASSTIPRPSRRPPARASWSSSPRQREPAGHRLYGGSAVIVAATGRSGTPGVVQPARGPGVDLAAPGGDPCRAGRLHAVRLRDVAVPRQPLLGGGRHLHGRAARQRHRRAAARARTRAAPART